MSNRKSLKPVKQRNWLAVHAFNRGGAGTHGDDKKKKDKYACRGKLRGEHDA